MPIFGSALVFQDVVEGLLDANPVDRQYVVKLSKLNKKSFVEAKWIVGNVWTKTQVEDLQNFLFNYKGVKPKKGKSRKSLKSYIDADECIKRGWLVSLTVFIKTVENIRCDYFILKWTASEGQIEIMRWLVETYSLNAEDIRFESNVILSFAASSGNLEIVQYLVETFNLTVEDVRSRDNDALRCAASRGHLEVVRYLVETFNLTPQDARSNHNQSLRCSSSHGHLEVVRYLVEKFNLTREDVKTKWDLGQSTLHWVAYDGHLEVIKYLVEKFELSREDITMEIFITICKKGHLKVLIYLFEKFEMTFQEVIDNFSNVSISRKHQDMKKYIKSLLTRE